MESEDDLWALNPRKLFASDDSVEASRGTVQIASRRASVCSAFNAKVSIRCVVIVLIFPKLDSNCLHICKMKIHVYYLIKY